MGKKGIKFAIRQNLHQDVCDWFNENLDPDDFGMPVCLEGDFKYLLYPVDNSSCFSNRIPLGYTEIDLDTFFKITGFKKTEIKEIGTQKTQVTAEMLYKALNFVGFTSITKEESEIMLNAFLLLQEKGGEATIRELTECKEI